MPDAAGSRLGWSPSVCPLKVAGVLGETQLCPQRCTCRCYSPAVTLGPTSDAVGWPRSITPAGGTEPVLAFGCFSLPQLGLEMISQRKIKACGFFSGAGVAVALAVMMGAGVLCTLQAVWMCCDVCRASSSSQSRWLSQGDNAWICILLLWS